MSWIDRPCNKKKRKKGEKCAGFQNSKDVNGLQHALKIEL